MGSAGAFSRLLRLIITIKYSIAIPAAFFKYSFRILTKKTPKILHAVIIPMKRHFGKTVFSDLHGQCCTKYPVDFHRFMHLFLKGF